MSPPSYIRCPKHREDDGTCAECIQDDEIVLVQTNAPHDAPDHVIGIAVVRDAQTVIANHGIQVHRPLVVHKSPMFNTFMHIWTVTVVPVLRATMCPCSTREHELYGKTVWRAIETGEWCGNPGQPWTSGDGQQHEDGWCDDCVNKRCPHCDE